MALRSIGLNSNSRAQNRARANYLPCSFLIITNRMEALSSDCSRPSCLCYYDVEINFLVLKHLEQYANQLPSLDILKKEMVGGRNWC